MIILRINALFSGSQRCRSSGNRFIHNSNTCLMPSGGLDIKRNQEFMRKVSDAIIYVHKQRKVA